MQDWFHRFLSGVEWVTCNWLASDRDVPALERLTWTEAAYLRQDELHSPVVSTLALLQVLGGSQQKPAARHCLATLPQLCLEGQHPQRPRREPVFLAI